MGSILLIVGMVLILFLMFRSSKKKERERYQMLDSISVGDEITTIGGIMGKVIRVKDDYFIIETGNDRTKLKITRGAVNYVDKSVNAKVSAPANSAGAKEVQVNNVKASKKD